MDFVTLVEIVKNHVILFDGNSPVDVNWSDTVIEIDAYEYYEFTEDNISNIRVVDNRILFEYNSETFSIQPMIKLDIEKYLQEHSK